jgi:cytochrome c6
MKPACIRALGAVSLVITFSSALPALADDTERLDLGREVFLERAVPACGICHTLADAGTDGEIGPTFASLRPSYDVVYKAITEGIGPMEPYTDHLSEEELDALAHYVSTVSTAE